MGVDDDELPRRWRGRERFVVLDTAPFDAGRRFLATWQCWRDDPQRCARLSFIAIASQLPAREDLAALHRDGLSHPELAAALRSAWPPLTPDLHRLAFDSGRVELLLARGDVTAWLPELVADVDAFDLDSLDSDARVCKALARLAAPGATLASRGATPGLHDRLRSAGFDVRPGDARDVTRARYAPRFVPRRAVARRPPASERHALIVGAGLAGCAIASALAEHGWTSTLLERNAQIASAASGNPAGIFHGIVNAHDGMHARFNRAAALAAHAAVRIALDAHGAAGSTQGLLRLETTLRIDAMRALLQRLHLPAEYVQALDAEATSACAGIALSMPAWFYAGGGWVQPAALARAFVERAGTQTTLRCGVDVQRLERTPPGWRLLDADGRPIAEAATVVLANAGDALRLLGEPGWPIESLRGQLSMVNANAAGIAPPRIPIAGAGYVLPAIDGRVMFGATAQAGDTDPAVRRADHMSNLAQLERLTGQRLTIDPDELQGRTAWRCSARDRLPVIGAVPDATAALHAARLDQPRFVPRLPGLHVFTALGSRGIAWCALGAQLLAAQIAGAPLPIEASLRDAVDPARFVSRRARRVAAR